MKGILLHVRNGVGRKTNWYRLNQTANYASRFRYEENGVTKRTSISTNTLGVLSVWAICLGYRPTKSRWHDEINLVHVLPLP